MKEFIVAAGYIGECCTKIHVAAYRIQARDEKDAVTRFKRRIAKYEWDVGDIVAIETNPRRKQKTT